MTWLPPPLVGLAIAGVIIMPILLFALRWAPSKMRRPGARFKLAVTLSVAAWLFAATSLVVTGTGVSLLDWIAGLSVLIGGALALFVVWSMLAWGFSVGLLMTLYAADRPLDLDSWMKNYTNGFSIQRVCQDRLRALVGLRLVQEDRAIFSARSPLSTVVWRLNMALRGVLGLGR